MYATRTMSQPIVLPRVTMEVDDTSDISKDIVHLARLALVGRPQDVRVYLRRLARTYGAAHPEAAQQMVDLLREGPTASSPVRHSALAAIPVDQDSRLMLARHDVCPQLDVEPIFDGLAGAQLRQLVAERQGAARLGSAGLTPTSSVLFTGPPGVGKTLAAKWLARELGVPLLTLELSAVMSGFLGRTGSNVRHVLDYAKGSGCVLLLDELDALAKRRDDVAEIGELKRLVTVLLLEIDDWPSDGLLVAATNHPSLLDPAVWRRFELRVEFPLPDQSALAAAVVVFLGNSASDHEEAGRWAGMLSSVLRGASFSDVERAVTRVRREVALGVGTLNERMTALVSAHLGSLPHAERVAVARDLMVTGRLSQREAHRASGISRDTLRKATAQTQGGQ